MSVNGEDAHPQPVHVKIGRREGRNRRPLLTAGRHFERRLPLPIRLQVTV